jgi:hypothetical protein
MNKWLERLEKLEYHQQLLLKMVRPEGYEFDRLVIEKNLSRDEVEQFYKLCEELSKKREEQKAEGFVFHTPLFREFQQRLHPRLSPEEVIDACIKQRLYMELMTDFKRNIRK